MAQRHYPGETIGIIGSTVSSALLAQAAGKLGYRTASLVLDEVNPVRQFASWQTFSEAYNDDVLRYFGGRVDVVTAEYSLLPHAAYQTLAAYTDVTLSQDMMAVTTDRLIERAFLEKARALVAPFSLVTSLRDVEEAIEYIGFPAVMKTTQRHLPGAHEHLILYSEADYELVEEKLDQGSCILEAWIPSVHKASCSIVRNERGQVLVYPVFEGVEGLAEEGQQIRYPAQLSTAVQNEIQRLSQRLAHALDLVGSLTVKVFITSAGVIYVNEISLGLKDEAAFTLGAMSISLYEATIRALAGLPLPTLKIKQAAAISLPMRQLDEEKVKTQLMLRTDWGFALYKPVGSLSDQLEGYVVVTGDSVSSCQRQIALTEIMKK